MEHLQVSSLAVNSLCNVKDEQTCLFPVPLTTRYGRCRVACDKQSATATNRRMFGARIVYGRLAPKIPRQGAPGWRVLEPCRVQRPSPSRTDRSLSGHQCRQCSAEEQIRFA